jgi:hypothetical protein
LLLTVRLDLTVVLDVLVLNLEELLGVLNSLINRWVDELGVVSQISVNLSESLIEFLNAFNNFFLANLQLADLVVEIDLELVD